MECFIRVESVTLLDSVSFTKFIINLFWGSFEKHQVMIHCTSKAVLSFDYHYLLSCRVVIRFAL